MRVIVDDDNSCENVNHPTFDDYKLDVTFRSYKQIESSTTDDVMKGEREPNPGTRHSPI